jgi:hypothetical protein
VDDSQADEPALPDQYPAKEACEGMAILTAQEIGLPTTISLWTYNERSGLKGDGCQVLAETDGSIAETWGGKVTALHEQILSNGWAEDMYYMGAGAMGMISTYRKDGMVCRYLYEAGPVDINSCPDDKPIGVCMNSLPPEEKEYKAVIDCSPDGATNLGGMGPEHLDDGVRVEFGKGATFQVLPGDLQPGMAQRFVLWAAVGQTMTITLTTEPEDKAVISVWGEDGTVYLSGKEMLAEWSEVLPKDQDYYVDIKNVSDEEIIYQIIFDIPPKD